MTEMENLRERVHIFRHDVSPKAWSTACPDQILDSIIFGVKTYRFRIWTQTSIARRLGIFKVTQKSLNTPIILHNNDIACTKIPVHPSSQKQQNEG